MYPSQQRFMLLLLGVLAIPLTAQAQAQPQYAYTAIGLTPYKSTALNISNSGKITGRTFEDNQAFLFSDGGLILLGKLSGDADSIGNGVNNAGHVVGESTRLDSSRAVLYANGSMTDLGSLGGPYTVANGINDAGEIVGSSTVGSVTAGTSWRAFLYRNGSMSRLVTLPGVSESSGNAINSHGQITGTVEFERVEPHPNGVIRAFLYENGVMKDLGSLGGETSRGIGINDLGHVVGMSTIVPGNSDLHHAFLYADGVMRDLGTLQEGASSEARGINNLGQVVGYYWVNTGRAFLYRRGDGMRDLNAMVDPASGWFIHGANSINDRQQIVALGCKDGQYGAVLLNPTHRDGLVAAGPGAAAGAAAASPAQVVGAPENPACEFG